MTLKCFNYVGLLKYISTLNFLYFACHIRILNTEKYVIQANISEEMHRLYYPMNLHYQLSWDSSVITVTKVRVGR